MSERHYDSDDGEFVDFATLDDWAERDKAKNAEIANMREGYRRIASMLGNDSDARKNDVVWAAFSLAMRFLPDPSTGTTRTPNLLGIGLEQNETKTGTAAQTVNSTVNSENTLDDESEKT